MKPFKALANFFGIGKKKRSIGRNRHLPQEMQAEIMAAAAQRQYRRNEARKPIYFQQTRLGLFK